jgi:hypothetical protein
MPGSEEFPADYEPFASHGDDTDSLYGERTSVDEVSEPFPDGYPNGSANTLPSTQQPPEHSLQLPATHDEIGNRLLQFPGASQHRPNSRRRAVPHATHTAPKDRAMGPAADELDLSTLQRTESGLVFQPRAKIRRDRREINEKTPAKSSSGPPLQVAAPSRHDAAAAVSSPAEDSKAGHEPQSESAAANESARTLLRVISQ